ncbi:MAG: MmgE/PrpD family protein, partial [Hyphomonadaceae bacterium]|nr:MmgE/PrpD family protein [Hyphomonadaceae bacterium]
GMTPNYARLCFPYLAAVTLMRGTVSLADFGETDLNDPDILDVASRIRVQTGHVKNPAQFVPQSATAKLINGGRNTAMIDKILGSPADPLSREQHIEKFRTCLAFGLSEVNAQGTANRLIDIVDDLERFDDCREIFPLASGI